jgi:phospholipase/carboxylesterase
MTGRERRPARAVKWTVPILVSSALVIAGTGGCGDADRGEPDGRAVIDAGGAVDALAPAARPIPELGPSGLASIEVFTGGASAADEEPLPLVIALHGNGDTPENFSKIFEGFNQRARLVVPRGPYAVGKGQAWIQAGGNDEVASLALNRAADKVAALVDELEAARPTKGKAVVTGFSQGGAVAFIVAARQPERVRAAIPMGAALPQFAWPDEERFLGNRPVVRALSGTNDELTKAVELRQCVVKLRMLKLDARARLYSETAHSISPAMKTDLFRLLSWLVAGTAEPPPCEPCPGDSMDPEACSLCSGGTPEPSAETGSRAASASSSSPRVDVPAPAGPDVALGSHGVASKIGRGTEGAGGSLPRDVIQRTFRVNMSSIRFCYERQLAAQPDLAGRVSVRLTIAPDGSVPSAEVVSSTLNSSVVERCVEQAVSRIRFPQPQGGAVIVTYPLTFAAMSQ